MRAAETGCEGLSLQVLGSGGPRSSGARASASYLLWQDGRARLLIDAGPGAHLRFAEAGADVSGLDAVFISHLHVDHSADLMAFLKSSSFGARRRTLPLFGPPGSDRFPSIESFVQSMIGVGGAYSYLGGFLAEGQPYTLEVNVLATVGAAQAAFESDGLSVRSVGVPHGPVPALAFDVRFGEQRVAFMGDQRADEARYVEMVRDADVLVAHMAIPERSPGLAAQLHAPPGRLGRVAAAANVGAMVLSHVMERSLADLDENLAAIRAQYTGPVVLASDLECFPLSDGGR